MRPITAQPGYIADDLKTLLATRQFVYAECYTIYCKDQQTWRYTTAQQDVNISIPVDGSMVPATFTSRQVQVSGLKSETGVGVEVDEQTLNMAFPPDLDYLGSMPYSQAIRWGRFDGATIRRDRYFASDWGSVSAPPQWVGGVPMFVGRMSSVDKLSRSSASMKVKSDLVLLSTQMPRKLMQATCLHTLFDPGCGLIKSAFMTPGVVAAGSTADTIVWAGADPTYSLGTLEIEDVNATTLVRTIDSTGAGVLYLSAPLEFAPLAGAHFNIYPGCARTYARCGFFGNTDRYQGFPFVPVAETAR